MSTATERQPLTDRERDIFKFLRDFRNVRGYCASVREVALHFGMKSPNGAWFHLWRIRRKGWITWEKNVTRTLRPTEAFNV